MPLKKISIGLLYLGFSLAIAQGENKTPPAFNFGTKDIKESISAHIRAVEVDGVFSIEDGDKKLALKFADFRGPAREMEGKGHFICVDFNLVGGEKDQQYDLDFWVKPDSADTAKLKVTEVKIHRHPVKEKGKWVKKARYSYVEE